MKIFFSAMFIIVLFFVMFIAANILYKRTNAYTNTRLDIKDFDGGIRDNIAAVNLGSTYSKYAFGAISGFGWNWFDFSLKSHSLEMDEAILKKYINRIAPGSLVIIVVAACMMLFRESEENILYYSVLGKNENPQYSLGGKIRKLLPLLSKPQKAIKIFFDDRKKQTVYDEYPDFISETQSKKELADLVEVWKGLFKIEDLKKTEISEELETNIAYNSSVLGRIIELCKRKELRAAVVVPPFSERLNHYFSEEFIKKTVHGPIERIKDIEKIPYLNYQKHNYFQKRPELFCDGGFRLNERGSRCFVHILSRDLQKYGVEIGNKTMMFK